MTFAGSNNLFLTGGLTLGTSNFITASGSNGSASALDINGPLAYQAGVANGTITLGGTDTGNNTLAAAPLPTTPA